MVQEVGVSASSRNGNFSANGMVISIPTGWNGKGAVPLKDVGLFQKVSISSTRFIYI